MTTQKKTLVQAEKKPTGYGIITREIVLAVLRSKDGPTTPTVLVNEIAPDVYPGLTGVVNEELRSLHRSGLVVRYGKSTRPSYEAIGAKTRT